MKLSEFEDKLSTVSDDKLLLMLEDTRKRGPEVAFKLILAEAKRRGMEVEDGPVGTSTQTPAGSEGGISPEGEAAPGGTEPAMGSAWLHEEANQGLPMIIKILIGIVVLGGIAAFLYVMLNKG